MIHELVVTSVPRGLQAGRSGFTTVLRTRGIHPELANRLEAASGYRHVHPPGDPRTPLVRSHVVIQSPVGQVSVLSRIVDAGNDYSGRSNRLAHLIALDAADVAGRTKSSPAAALLGLEREGKFLRQWSGDPREAPVSPLIAAAAAGRATWWLRGSGRPWA